jgi:ABC-2 type transport system ATP-binding protein
MRQKTALVQALLSDPDVLFLDEPTSGLDPHAVRTFRNLVEDVASDGMTVFLSTHILPVVDDVADRVGVIRDGTLVAEGTPDELKARLEDRSESSLEDAFVEVTTEARTDD